MQPALVQTIAWLKVIGTHYGNFDLEVNFQKLIFVLLYGNFCKLSIKTALIF